MYVAPYTLTPRTGVSSMLIAQDAKRTRNEHALTPGITPKPQPPSRNRHALTPPPSSVQPVKRHALTPPRVDFAHSVIYSQ